MRTTLRSMTLATLLAFACGLGLSARPAQAQNNTYADFPYNQGSLFYHYIPPGGNKPKTYAPRARYAPRTYQAPTQAAPYYVTPQPLYQTPYPSRPAASYVAPQPTYGYYPTQPYPTQPYQSNYWPTRRGMNVSKPWLRPSY